MAPQPPGPGLPVAAPSVKMMIGKTSYYRTIGDERIREVRRAQPDRRPAPRGRDPRRVKLADTVEGRYSRRQLARRSAAREQRGHADVRTTTVTSPGLLDRMAAALDIALSGRGFPPGERADAGDALIRRWVRDCTWKRDIVEVAYRRGRTQLSINVSVEVPAAGRHIGVDGTNVGYLAGRPDGYPLPRGCSAPG